MEYSSGDIALRQNRRFFADLKHRHIPNKIQICRPARLLSALQFSHNEGRNIGRIIGKLVLPPSYRQVPPEGLAVVQISPNNRRFKVKTLLHNDSSIILPYASKVVGLVCRVIRRLASLRCFSAGSLLIFRRGMWCQSKQRAAEVNGQSEVSPEFAPSYPPMLHPT